MFNRLATTAAAILIATSALAQGNDSADLSKKLSNPVADLISVPLQFNYNQGYPGGQGEQYYLNIQPVIPISIGENWNLISRTILPVYNQNISDAFGRQIGFGPTTQSFFFSPKAPGPGGLIWGAGPVFLLPTATDDLGTDQWGAGLTGVVLKQSSGWTYGALVSQLWSVTDNDEDGEINQFYAQPFLSFTTKKATSFTINTESTYDWVAEEWSVPINVMVGQIVKLGKQPVQLSLGTRYWADAPENGPEGWGARFQVTFLFPK
ncbi:transporter [Tropicimonas sp. IMCC6043]|uniref:transporter n=1 Tax=Tropicimonas sp. IMCC6043 TaxID=2510645 RepID=UPI00101D1EBF|nr:transporter [Tropicimonas sp. IMCC6043]RYH08124.1 transporter [Tropicimonas sp. IMCC6043]